MGEGLVRKMFEITKEEFIALVCDKNWGLLVILWDLTSKEISSKKKEKG